MYFWLFVKPKNKFDVKCQKVAATDEDVDYYGDHNSSRQIARHTDRQT